MMRLYLSADRTVRLHVWDRALAVPGAAPVHTHPWDFNSLVVVGRVFNQRFTAPEASTVVASTWNRVRMKCGVGAHIVATLPATAAQPDRCQLVEGAVETWHEGESYWQDRDEIHRSMPEDGTVTIVTRRFGPDSDHAWVFWRGAADVPWKSAEPRPSTDAEVVAVAARSLEAWW